MTAWSRLGFAAAGAPNAVDATSVARAKPAVNKVWRGGRFTVLLLAMECRSWVGLEVIETLDPRSGGTPVKETHLTRA
ncbi:hypothetical protein Afil01_05780 [Actinorhabdospora filicis]|uniref:Uncharacterized protein n=1 Tax=Actinorhabdospora filicis TaxID=1785913 RepID=A0A9W6W7R9_9ACTN|nr:hypothetical protein Afil01_05780 [Actinorhabdospora filicis]